MTTTLGREVQIGDLVQIRKTQPYSGNTMSVGVAHGGNVGKVLTINPCNEMPQYNQLLIEFIDKPDTQRGMLVHHWILAHAAEVELLENL